MIRGRKDKHCFYPYLRFAFEKLIEMSSLFLKLYSRIFCTVWLCRVLSLSRAYCCFLSILYTRGGSVDQMNSGNVFVERRELSPFIYENIRNALLIYLNQMQLGWNIHLLLKLIFRHGETSVYRCLPRYLRNSMQISMCIVYMHMCMYIYLYRLW